MADRAPPANIAVEQAVLGALLCNNKAYENCGGLLPEHFFDDVHRELYRAIQRRIEAGRTVDALTLKSALEFSGLLNDVGGVAYLTSLLTAMVSIASVREYAAAIRDAYVRRELIAAAQQVIDRAYGGDLEDGDGTATAAWGIDAIERATASGGGVQAATMATAVADAMRQSEAAQRGTAGATGLLTGVPTLDAMWRGLYPGSLDILAARPRGGKTSLAMQIARHVAGEEFPVAVFSLEMPKEHLGLVNLASLTGISSDDIRSGRYDSQQAHSLILAERVLAKLPIHIIDQADITLSGAIGEMRVLKRKKGVRLIIADHRNLFERDEEHSRATNLDWYRAITRRLKQAAKMLDLPILCLIQIRRGTEGREDPRPRLDDIEYGGEQDADNVVLLHRPALTMAEFPAKKPNQTAEAYSNAQSAWYAQRAELQDVADVIFAKRRFGPTGTVRLKFDGPRTTFADWPIDEAPPEDLWAQM